MGRRRSLALMAGACRYACLPSPTVSHLQLSPISHLSPSPISHLLPSLPSSDSTKLSRHLNHPWPSVMGQHGWPDALLKPMTCTPRQATTTWSPPSRLPSPVSHQISRLPSPVSRLPSPVSHHSLKLSSTDPHDGPPLSLNTNSCLHEHHSHHHTLATTSERVEISLH